MTEETLPQLLARLHQRLSGTSAIDPEARDMLAIVMGDIESALRKGPPTAASAAPTVTTAPMSPEARVAAEKQPLEVLEALAVRFESEHPAVAQTLRQLGTLLSNAGI